MKYPAGQWRGARGAGPAGGSLPEARPTEEGTFCPLYDLTFSLPWARKLSKGPLRTLDSPLPTLAHRGVEVLCGKGLASVRAATGRGASLSLPDPQRVRPAPRVRTPRSPVPGLGLAVPPSERLGEKRGQDCVPGHKQRKKLFWVSRRANLVCGGNQKGSMGEVVLKKSLRVIRSSVD